MTYQEAIDYLFSQLPMFSRTGAPAYKPGLDTSIAIAEHFGNPEKKFESVHIGGTNGKGSTSHMIASVLQSQGYKVGLYTSPHLVDFRERMRINGEMIPEEKVIKFVEEWKSGVEKEPASPKKSGHPEVSSLHPSFFELTMMMAFDWFAAEKVDIAVIEVGMGGRLDSTNIITPLLSVITNISHDHNQFLGDTLEKIASEKAGIIKPGVPVVIGETQSETEKIFRDKAKEVNSPIYFADQKSDCDKPFFEEKDYGWEIEYNSMELSLPLGGDYQKKNLQTVLEAIKQLGVLGFDISNEATKHGLENVCGRTGLMGRWMILDRKPLTLADTGHNIAGIEHNMAQLHRIMARRKDAKLRIVIGFVADKAIDKILRLLPHDAIYYVTNAQIPRALPASELIRKFREEGFEAKEYPGVKEAYDAAKEEASESDVIFIGGSTFIVADFLHYVAPCGERGLSTDCC